MIQKRLPGQTLTQLWDHLNRDQKLNVAKLVTNLVCQIATVEAPAGIKFCVPARGLGGGSFNKPNTWPAQPQSAEEHLLEQCERWRDYQLSQGVCFEEIWDALATISKSLGIRGFLDGPSVLSHGDLKPYNLLAEIRSPTEVEITGVLDWDSAIIAPEFMAYRAPFWLWIPDEMNSVDEDDESTANFEPQTDEDRQLRDTFMLHASEKYKRLAFAPEALLARRMYTILQKGIFGPWSMMEAEHIIREWAELHPEDDVRPVDADPTER
ncbi:hypothetical protein BKA66DRAFT_448010 [Pyrenochaeta sp. MPI-SDFR-AT-0127]|nr:hypothetical protein BKA66DRAFT_448010 [Pyrenochaeta sp. MPI-SDFR-AT-0127]